MKNLKKIIALCTLTLCISLSTYGIVYTSTGNGAWEISTTWSPAGLPGVNDDVTINAGHTVTNNVGGASSLAHHLTVDGTLSCGSSMVLSITGNYTVNGTESGTSGQINFNTQAPAVISGTGTFSPRVRWVFYKNMTIAPGTVITKTIPITITTNRVVTNQGTITVGPVFSTAGCGWINDVNSSITVTHSDFLTHATSTLKADAAGNTIHYTFEDVAAIIKSPTLAYYNLNISGTKYKLLASDVSVLNNFSIQSSSFFSANNFNLAIAGNWLKNGTFAASAGKTVTFNGSAAQTISGTGTTIFKGLAVNNAMGVSISSGTYILDEVLTVSNGTFNTGGFSFTMTSTATKTARIAPITGTGAIAGNFNIQRFITARDTTWADFSSPVQTTTFLDWDNELPAISYVSAQSAYTYNESGDAYVPVTSSATALTPGVGFEIFLSGDFAYANFPATTMNTIGVPNQGDKNFSSLVSNTVQGWNLVGNPFASSIAWSSVYTASGGASSGMYDYIEMYDYTIGDWRGYTSADAIEVGATQGFWVYGLSGPMTLLIPESSKTTSSNSSIKTNDRIQPYFTLKLGFADASIPNSHTFKVAVSEFASDGLDENDLPFRNSLSKVTPALYGMVDGKKININTFNSANDSYSMPLKTEVNISGNYKIIADGFDFVADYSCVTLQDNLLGKTIDLNEGNEYFFTLNANDNPDRFVLHFGKDVNCKSMASTTSPSVDFSNQIEVLPTQDGNVINFNLGEPVITNISVRNILGQTIVESISVNASNQSVNLNLPEGFSGLYLINIESEKYSITKKFVKN